MLLLLLLPCRPPTEHRAHAHAHAAPNIFFFSRIVGIGTRAPRASRDLLSIFLSSCCSLAAVVLLCTREARARRASRAAAAAPRPAAPHTRSLPANRCKMKIKRIQYTILSTHTQLPRSDEKSGMEISCTLIPIPSDM